MKVLFAVSNENISETIVKRYQKDYKEIISSKNVYYFNAIQKELQKDNTYDRIVVSEDLEPFTKNDYETIDRFIFEKLDTISDEAIDNKRSDTPIILICSDRRNKSEDMLVKLFSIGVYNAVLGNDRNIAEICRLIKKPRTKKEAKTYYNIDTDDVKYAPESEDEVSEVEIQNILNHYKKLGKNEEKFAESFENIASQYNEEQLKLIASILPLNVKAVLESTSKTYQKIMTSSVREYVKKSNENDGISMNFIPNKSKPIGDNIVVPSAMNKAKVRKVGTQRQETIAQQENIVTNNIIEDLEKKEEISENNKRRGRPRKNSTENIENEENSAPKRRGRPRKNPVEVENKELEDSVNLFEIPELKQEEKAEENSFSDILPGFENINFDNNTSEAFENINVLKENNHFEPPKYEDNNSKEILNTNERNIDIQSLLSSNKKIVSFVGTSKNGTSFIVNNVAEYLSNCNVKVAILDTTKNKNSYYIFTQNEERLRNIAGESIRRLHNGIAQGIMVNNNLTVYTGLPDDEIGIDDYKVILQTLVNNYDLVLIDCDFNTPGGYFKESQEIYLIQSLDILTIQPLTSFLRELKSKNILNQEKIRIIINKNMKIRGLTDKALIGGMSFYNEPSMSFMTELFNRDLVRYFSIPFEQQTYIKYLEGLVNCQISLNGYSKIFMQLLKDLCSAVYPLINGSSNKKKKNKKEPVGSYQQTRFSTEMNDTLNQMKNSF